MSNENEVLKIQEDGKILLNFHPYEIDFVGTVFDLRLIENKEPKELEDDNSSSRKRYIKNNKLIKIEFDELLTIDPEINSHIELRWLIRNGVYVLMKRLKKKNNKLILQEAILHALAFHCLKKFKLTKIIPEIFDIVKINDEVVFTLEAFPSAIKLSDFLNLRLRNDNFICFIELLAQIALCMLPLQHVLFFNHRDLKSDNILVDESQKVNYSLTFRNKKITVKGSSRIIIIDFGFSCVGYDIGATNILSGGPSLPALDACPRDGRDIFLMLSSLYSFEQFRRNLHPLLNKLFKRWMNFDGNYTGESIKNSADKTWIYKITSNSFFSAPNCSPMMILTDIAYHFPSVVKIE
jgi:hypothetical protein